MKSLNIAILGSRGYPYVYSGYETFISELVPRLLKRGHQITVYCHRGLFKSHPKVVNGIRLRYVLSVNSKTLSQFTSSFFSTIDACGREYDIIFYVNSANGPFGLLTKLFRKKTAINVDGLEWLRPKWKGIGAKYFYCSSWLSTKLFDVVVTDSARMSDIYKKEFNSTSVTIAYGSTPTYSQQSEIINTLGVDADGYYLVVGRLIPDNNADIIVHGFEKSKTKRKLIIVGDVPYRDHYADSIKQTRDPRIIFTGYIRDQNLLRELYCNSYAYFHGHEYGGTNPTLLKALACGCFILALDTEFSREVLNEENYGMYFNKSSSVIASLIDSIDNNNGLADSYRRKSRERISQNYSWEKITNQYEELFLSVCK
jgi:glycosyltransferase involved in cell wall biosynthesis